MKSWAAWVVGFFVALVSCQKDSDVLNANDVQNVNTEAAAATYTNEASDIATSTMGAISTSQLAGARESGYVLRNLVNWDERLQCAVVTIIRTGSKQNPSGSIVINYDSLSSTCTDSHGVRRKGQIIITYSGRRWMPGSTYNIRLVNFYRNDIHIEGNLTLTTQQADTSQYLLFKSVLDSGKVTFGDGKFITREHTITREWVRTPSPLTDEWITLTKNPVDNSFSQAKGTCKNGETYTMQVTKDIVEKASCRINKIFIPVSGTKVITVGNETYTIDYGNGTCSDVITITIRGRLKQINFNPEGN